MNKPFVLQEWAVATNTDAGLQKIDALPYIKERYKEKSERRVTGEYGYRILHPAKGRDTVEVPANRHVISREKWTTPGVPHEDSS
jgi:hypothetical protein